jgi:Mg/Co/Ni transporter MgtE
MPLIKPELIAAKLVECPEGCDPKDVVHALEALPETIRTIAVKTQNMLTQHQIYSEVSSPKNSKLISLEPRIIISNL